MTQATDFSTSTEKTDPHDDPPLQMQISDRPEPMPVWLAWLCLVLLIACAAWAMYAYVVTQYVPE